MKELATLTAKQRELVAVVASSTLAPAARRTAEASLATVNEQIYELEVCVCALCEGGGAQGRASVSV